MAISTNDAAKEQPGIAEALKLTDVFYGAPTVITLFAPIKFLFSIADCVAAAENIMLAADFSGIGFWYIGQGWTAFSDTHGWEILRKREIRADYYAVMLLLLDYPRRQVPCSEYT